MMPFPSKPRKLTVSGGAKANRHKVSKAKAKMSGTPHTGQCCRKAETTRDCRFGHDWDSRSGHALKGASHR